MELVGDCDNRSTERDLSTLGPTMIPFAFNLGVYSSIPSIIQLTILIRETFLCYALCKM